MMDAMTGFAALISDRQLTDFSFKVHSEDIGWRVEIYVTSEIVIYTFGLDTVCEYGLSLTFE